MPRWKIVPLVDYQISIGSPRQFPEKCALIVGNVEFPTGYKCPYRGLDRALIMSGPIMVLLDLVPRRYGGINIFMPFGYSVPDTKSVELWWQSTHQANTLLDDPEFEALALGLLKENE